MGTTTTTTTMDPNYLGSFSICGIALNGEVTKLKIGQSITIHSFYWTLSGDCPDANCKTMVYSEHKMILEFYYLDIKDDSGGNCVDYLSVDGQKFCGRSTPDPLERNLLSVNYTEFSLHYLSDYNNQYRGFDLTIRAVENDVPENSQSLAKFSFHLSLVLIIAFIF